jgi:hypothetical protein
MAMLRNPATAAIFDLRFRILAERKAPGVERIRTLVEEKRSGVPN